MDLITINKYHEFKRDCESPMVDKGTTPLMLAALYGYPDVIVYICDKGVTELNAKTVQGNTALELAVLNNNIVSVCRLCERGAKVYHISDILSGSKRHIIRSVLTIQQFRWNCVVLMDILPVQLVRKVHKWITSH